MHPSFDLNLLAARVHRHVQVLAQSPRTPGSRAHRDAEDYIANHLQDAGFLVQEATDHVEGFACTNLVARMLPENKSLPLVVIGAHYDTVEETPGADDNASAVAALLELARWIGPRLNVEPLTARLELVAFDLEEYGYLGSEMHAAGIQNAGTPIRGMISLEMLGYTDNRPGSQQLPPNLVGRYPDTADFIGICGNDDSLALMKTVAEGMKTVPNLPVECLSVPGRGETLPPVRLSDHRSFWDRGYQALMITDTSFLRNPHYHRETDAPETLDYPFLARVTAGVCEAVWRLLQQ